MVKKITVAGESVLISTPSIFEEIFGTGKDNKKRGRLIKETNKALAGKKGAREAVKHSGIKKKIKIIETKLPYTVGGFADDDKTIILNKKMPEGEKFWTVTHELEHMERGDVHRAEKLGMFWPSCNFAN